MSCDVEAKRPSYLRRSRRFDIALRNMPKPSIPDEKPLKFTFSAHLLEDLGVNLYTSVNKALVEFVANAYDAESPLIRIKFLPSEVKRQAEICRKKFEAETAQTDGSADLLPLEKRTLTSALCITLEDEGHGMTKDELEEKFLVVGRRRRDDKVFGAKSKNGKRLVMGRKGLGKLAGFGIGHRVQVISKAEGADYSTEITLDYDELLKASAGSLSESQAAVPTRILIGKEGLKKKGTRIILSRLVYQTVHSVDEEDIVTALGRHFGILNPREYSIHVNSRKVLSLKKKYAYSWPEDSKRTHDQLVRTTFKDSESGRSYSFGYRLRFAEEKKYLPAIERGVRVYAHNRLASFPSMLDVNSNAHGFRYSDYLDGIVEADFIDELPTDYIATDRSDLRWETPPLAGLRSFLTTEIHKALGKFADKRMQENVEKVSKDPFTQKVIDSSELPDHRRRTAMRFATALAASEPKGVASDYYQTTIQEVIASLGHGDIITSINKLASEDRPDLSRLVKEITRSTRREFDEFLKFAQVRLKGIEGLEKIVRAQDFRDIKCDEKALHRLFAKNPWLINPLFSQFLTSDERESVVAGQLAKVLQVGKHTARNYDPRSSEEQTPLARNKRPDLVFLLSSEAKDHAEGRVIVVELKAPNTPLHSDHLDQLEDYIISIEKWRDTPGRGVCFKVEGQLIGSVETGVHRNNPKVLRLQNRIEKNGLDSQWKVRDIAAVLSETKTVHKELLSTFEKAKGFESELE